MLKETWVWVVGHDDVCHFSSKRVTCRLGLTKVAFGDGNDEMHCTNTPSVPRQLREIRVLDAAGLR